MVVVVVVVVVPVVVFVVVVVVVVVVVTAVVVLLSRLLLLFSSSSSVVLRSCSTPAVDVVKDCNRLGEEGPGDLAPRSRLLKNHGSNFALSRSKNIRSGHENSLQSKVEGGSDRTKGGLKHFLTQGKIRMRQSADDMYM